MAEEAGAHAEGEVSALLDVHFHVEAGKSREKDFDHVCNPCCESSRLIGTKVTTRLGSPILSVG